MKKFVVIAIGLIGSWALASQKEPSNSSFCYHSPSRLGFIAFFQEALLPQCEIKFPCADVPPEEMVRCLQTRASINFQLKNSLALQKFFNDQGDLQNMFIDDPEYKEVFMNLHLRDLFEAGSGVAEGYTVAEHTTRALIAFESQRPFFELDKKMEPAFVSDKTRFMKHLVAYHDIGKSISAKIYNNNSEEIRFSYPIVWRVMNASLYSKEEATFAIALVATHKEIGNFMQRKITVDQAATLITHYAGLAKVSPQVFLDYLEMLFISDAGSYPYLVGKIFDTDDEGRMTPKDQDSLKLIRDELE